MEFFLIFINLSIIFLIVSRVKKFGIVERDEKVDLQQSRRTPDWAKHAVIYEVYIRNFSETGDFKGLINRLPELKELGVDIIWLMPIFPIGKKGRKGKLGCPYSIQDYLETNPEYGTKENFHQLVQQIHNLGMKIIIDMVANHSSNDHVEMKNHPDWFARDKKGKFTRQIADWSDVTDLNYKNPELRKYMIDVILFWIKEFDIDGYRCDVAGMIPDDFWIEARKEIEKVKSDVFMLAEWDDPQMHLFSFDSTYDWIMYYKYLEVLKQGAPASDIIDLLIERHGEFPEKSLRLRFIENHDQERAITAFGLSQFKPYATFIFIIDGIPLLYNGQEVGENKFSTLFDKDDINWDKSHAQEIRNFYKYLISLRKKHSILIHGELKKVENNYPEHVVTFLRCNEQGKEFFVAVNFSKKKLDVKFDYEIKQQAKLIDVNSQSESTIATPLNSLSMEPFSTQLLVVISE